MNDEITMYWPELCQMNQGQLAELINDASQPVLRVGLARALQNFAKSGDFDTLEKISDVIFMADFDDDFYDDDEINDPFKN